MVTIGERFWKKVNKTNTCWLWEGYRDRHGYGQTRINYKLYYAHRAAYSATYGDIPKGVYILHRCDVPACVNPDHLFAGTQKDNVRDMRKKGRMCCGERAHGSKITEKDARIIRESMLSGNELAERYNISRSHVYDIRHGRRWAHLGD